jgi:hypothetical protein
MKGFFQKWCEWINHFVIKESQGIKVNDDVGTYFQTNQGLRQGGLQSLLLFNLVADMLVVLISRAKEEGQINDIVPHLFDGGFLFYNTHMV